MNQEILNKLHAVLYKVSPLVSDRERIIEEMGDTIWLESLEKMIVELPEDKRNEVVELLNSEEVKKALEIIEASNIDVEGILAEVSVNIMEEVISNSTAS